MAATNKFHPEQNKWLLDYLNVIYQTQLRKSVSSDIQTLRSGLRK